MTITDAPEVNREALQMLADVMREHPGRFEAYARIHPWYGDDSERLLVHAIRELGFCGLKLHPVSSIGHPADEVAAPDARGGPARRADHAALRRRPLLHAAGGGAGGAPRARSARS